MRTQKMVLFFDMDSVYKDQVEDQVSQHDINDDDNDNSTIASVDSTHHRTIESEAESDGESNNMDTKPKKASLVEGTAQPSESNHPHQCSPGSQTVGKRKRAVSESSSAVGGQYVCVQKPIFNLEIPNNALNENRDYVETIDEDEASPPSRFSKQAKQSSFGLKMRRTVEEEAPNGKQGNWVCD